MKNIEEIIETLNNLRKSWPLSNIETYVETEKYLKNNSNLLEEFKNYVDGPTFSESEIKYLLSKIPKFIEWLLSDRAIDKYYHEDFSNSSKNEFLTWAHHNEGFRKESKNNWSEKEMEQFKNIIFPEIEKQLLVVPGVFVPDFTMSERGVEFAKNNTEHRFFLFLQKLSYKNNPKNFASISQYRFMKNKTKESYLVFDSYSKHFCFSLKDNKDLFDYLNNNNPEIIKYLKFNYYFKAVDTFKNELKKLDEIFLDPETFNTTDADRLQYEVEENI